MSAKTVVKTLLEDDYDAHVKAHERIQTWDKAHASARQLLGLKQKSLSKFRELGVAIGYERALAKVGLRREDVSHPIYGAQIGSIDNYKRTQPAKVCKQRYCMAKKPQPLTSEVCRECNEPLTLTQVPLSFTDLHNKLSRHMLGVETNDGRRVWFDEPLSPNFEPEAEPDAPTKPLTAEDRERQKRLGKWW